MIWALFGLALLAYAYGQSQRKDLGNEMMMWTCILMGVLLIANDAYVGYVLPWQIWTSYNAGAGITKGNDTR